MKSPSPPTVIPRSPLLKLASRIWAITAAAALAQFMIVLDERVVNIALPTIRVDLGMGTAMMQWVITGYLVTFGGLLLFGARASDLFGRRRMFLIGVVVFTMASLAGGLAPGGGVLIGARLLQGIGAAIIAPSSLTLITAVNLTPQARARGMGVWAVMTSAGAAAGVVFGGVLTEWLGWRSVMFVNVPIGAALVVAALATLVPSKTLPRSNMKLDIAGAALVTIGVGALVYGIAVGARLGWVSIPVLASLTGGVVALVVFVLVEQRSSAPLLRLGLLGIRSVRRANISLVAFGAALTASLYYLSLYLQRGMEYDPLQAGLALLPMSVLLGAGALVAPRLVRTGIRGLPVYGSVTAAAGLIWLALAGTGPFLTTVLPPTLILGAGLGVVLVPITVAATTGVSVDELGTASGLLNVSRQIGGAVGLAALVTIVDAIAPSSAAGNDGTGIAMTAALCALTAVSAIGLTRTTSPTSRPRGTRP